jgi:glycine/D-amino acid oxidase-like deaminating enzyme
LLLRRGHRPERLDAEEIRRRFPAWSTGQYVDGYFNPDGGYAESGRVTARLIALAEQAGAVLRAGARVAALAEGPDGAGGVVLADGTRLPADGVVVAAGAWTRFLLPELGEALRSTGMPVFHLQPAQPELFEAVRFPVFGAGIAETGYYGFPLHPVHGVVKVANHGPGRALHPESPERVVTAEETAALRAFLRATFPALAEAPIVHTRVCLYSDTWDGHLWIARDPERPALVVAAGDSGHGFKFAPVLGDLIAGAVEGEDSLLLRKFRWRPEIRPPRSEEAARFQEHR